MRDQAKNPTDVQNWYLLLSCHFCSTIKVILEDHEQ